MSGQPQGLPLRLGWLVVLMLAAPLAWGSADSFADAQKETLYRELLGELRCMVCPNQSLLDSPAGLADDLRRRTRQLVAAGYSRAQVVDYMAERYGEFILYRPRLRPQTWLLWFAPLLLLAAAGIWLYRHVRRAAHLAESGG